MIKRFMDWLAGRSITNEQLYDQQKRIFVELDNCFLTLLDRSNNIMTTIADIKAAAEAEAVEVKARIDALAAEVQALKDALANGVAVTEAELADLLSSVQNIFTPAPAVPAG